MAAITVFFHSDLHSYLTKTWDFCVLQYAGAGKPAHVLFCSKLSWIGIFHSPRLPGKVEHAAEHAKGSPDFIKQPQI